MLIVSACVRINANIRNNYRLEYACGRDGKTMQLSVRPADDVFSRALGEDPVLVLRRRRAPGMTVVRCG